MPFTPAQVTRTLGILTALVFGLMAVLQAPGTAFAVVAIVVGAIWALVGVLYSNNPVDNT